MRKKRKKTVFIKKRRPENKEYIQFYVGLGVIAGSAEGPASSLSDVNSSSNFTFGLRYKHKINNIEAIGAYLAYDDDSYSLMQDANKLPLDTINGIGKLTMHKKENLTYHAFTLGIYDRINFNKHRGNKLGTYIDLGLYGSGNFRVDHYTEDNINGNKVRYTQPNLLIPKKLHMVYMPSLDTITGAFMLKKEYRMYLQKSTETHHMISRNFQDLNLVYNLQFSRCMQVKHNLNYELRIK